MTPRSLVTSLDQPQRSLWPAYVHKLIPIPASRAEEVAAEVIDGGFNLGKFQVCGASLTGPHDISPCKKSRSLAFAVGSNHLQAGIWLDLTGSKRKLGSYHLGHPVHMREGEQRQVLCHFFKRTVRKGAADHIPNHDAARALWVRTLRDNGGEFDADDYFSRALTVRRFAVEAHVTSVVRKAIIS